MNGVFENDNVHFAQIEHTTFKTRHHESVYVMEHGGVEVSMLASQVDDPGSMPVETPNIL